MSSIRRKQADNPMSLHVDLSPVAHAALERQRRNATISSVVMAILAMVLLLLVLGIIALKTMIRETPTIVTYQTTAVEETEITGKKISTSHDRRPSAPSSSMARVIAANTASNFRIPIPDVDVTTPSMNFGDGHDFGSGWGDGGSDGGGGGGGNGMFGSSNRASGGIEGSLYDFKQKPGGGEIPYNLADPGEFVGRVLRLQKEHFSDSSLTRHFRAPKNLYLTHLAVPFSDASSGPKFFEAEKMVKASGWIVHYRGRVTVPRRGTYRFVGLGDDYLVVMLNGRMRLAACWEDIQSSVGGRWTPSKPTGTYKSPFNGMRLVYGDWVNLRAGETLDIDLAIGERPGGKVGFLLHIEEKGVDYRKAADGRPILPLFTMAPISEEEKTRITREFGSYEFEWRNVPIFRTYQNR